MIFKRFPLLIIIGSILILLSGCTIGDSCSYLDLTLIDEPLASFEEEYVDLTHTDLSSYPTLTKTIQDILNPSKNITHTIVEIPAEEMSEILDNLLRMPNNDTYTYFFYTEHLFQIYFAVC